MSKFGALTKHSAIEGFRRAGIIKTKETFDVYSKFLITFEKTQGNTRIINMNKLLTCVLLLSKDMILDKVSHIFGIYAIGGETSGVLKRANVRQLLDHICFTVIYAVPNLAYHHCVPGYG
jgi:hypothetical protein